MHTGGQQILKAEPLNPEKPETIRTVRGLGYIYDPK
jgi:DNA-binding response OmpR family regulator